MKVAVVGASDKPQRYSYQAVMLLREKGHTPCPVHPKLRDIAGIPVHATLDDVPEPVDLVTLYLAPERQANVAEAILRRRPRRVVFNPGAENPALAARLRQAGIEPVEACTLVLLKTGRLEEPPCSPPN